jgi:hypothetical protein
MSRYKATGEKKTSMKAERRHAKAVDAEIKNPTVEARQKTDKTFNQVYKQVKRYRKGSS